MSDSYRPEVGEICALNGISWTPWVLVLAVSRHEGRATFAILDEMDDDVYEPIPDSFTLSLEETVGDPAGRKEVAAAVAARDGISKLTAPFHRFDSIGSPGIQGTNARRAKP